MLFRGDLIEAARVSCGLSARAAAKQIGVSHVSLRAWERGESQPSMENASAMARLYGVHIDELVGVDSSEVRALPAEWPDGLKAFVCSSLAEQVGLMPREVLMLARAGWLDPKERNESQWMLVLIALRHARGEDPATGMMARTTEQ